MYYIVFFLMSWLKIKFIKAQQIQGCKDTDFLDNIILFGAGKNKHF